MQQILTIALVVVCIILILLIAMQPSKSNAASMLSGSDDGQPKTKARGFEAFLMRATTTFSILFFIITLALTYLSAQ